MQISIGPREQSSLPILKRVQAGIRMLWGATSRPITIKLMYQLHDKSWSYGRSRRWHSSGFFELIRDMSVMGGHSGATTQPCSKSDVDQFGKGAHIIIGRSHTPLLRGPSTRTFLRHDVWRPCYQTVVHHPDTEHDPQDDYAGHSFGPLLWLALLTLLSRPWQSAAFLQYIRTPAEQLASFASQLTNRRNVDRRLA